MKWIALLMILALVPAAFAEADTATGAEEQGIEPMVVPEVDLIDCGQVSGTVFAMDTTHDQDPGDAPDFLQDLVDEGYYVGLVDLNVNPEALDCVDVLYLTSIKNNYQINGAYTSGEIDMIEAWVLAGGGLFFTSDWGQFSANTAALAERFTIDVHGNEATDYDDNWGGNDYWPLYEMDNFISSPIFDGVDGHVEVAGTSFVVEQGSPLIPIIRTDDDGTADPVDVPVMAAGFYGEGCVVTTGDSNWLHQYSDGYHFADNPRMASNVVDFLTRCDQGEIPEFGLFAGIAATIGALIGVVLLRKRH